MKIKVIICLRAEVREPEIDLWSFLDIPRSRLVKYPLLLKEILRHTPKDHPDVQLLEEAVSSPINDSYVFQVYLLACRGRYTVILSNLMPIESA